MNKAQARGCAANQTAVATLSLLGTIYSQLLTNSSTDHVANYSRLTTDIEEELLCLQDQLEALWEVKGGYFV